jgi:hypothetical protein
MKKQLSQKFSTRFITAIVLILVAQANLTWAKVEYVSGSGMADGDPGDGNVIWGASPHGDPGDGLDKINPNGCPGVEFEIQGNVEQIGTQQGRYLFSDRLSMVPFFYPQALIPVPLDFFQRMSMKSN